MVRVRALVAVAAVAVLAMIVAVPSVGQETPASPTKALNKVEVDWQFQWPISVTASSQYSEGSWSAAQCVGPPNTAGYGDIPTAWAPKSADAKLEWLELTYRYPVIPSFVEVYESSGAPCTVKVSVLQDGILDPGWEVILDVTDQPAPEAYTGTTPLVNIADAHAVKVPVRRVRIEVDTSRPGWQEIDTVALVGSYAVGPLGGEQSTGAFRWWAENARASSSYGTDRYSPAQATGMPDTPGGGDRWTAWAASVADGGTEWLEVYYPQPLIATELHIHESCGPGFVTKVEAQDEDTAAWVTLWEGTDPTKDQPGIFSLTFPDNPVPAHIYRISVDTGVPGWNEIDAVELVGNPVG